MFIRCHLRVVQVVRLDRQLHLLQGLQGNQQGLGDQGGHRDQGGLLDLLDQVVLSGQVGPVCVCV